MEMVKVPESFAVQQVKRTRSLQDFINRFEEQMGRELTERQIATLIKQAEELISAVEKEITVATLVLNQLEDKLS
ncbi:MAG: hypothetical protein NWE77_02940 [Candidatus Bathyarchaeota archaeon]|jgi:hypothetical protein|nr:hypothetical protein [Candidatus Bathyarchaeota archaeon]